MVRLFFLIYFLLFYLVSQCYLLNGLAKCTHSSVPKRNWFNDELCEFGFCSVFISVFRFFFFLFDEITRSQQKEKENTQREINVLRFKVFQYRIQRNVDSAGSDHWSDWNGERVTC